MTVAIVYCDNENIPYFKYGEILESVLAEKKVRVLSYKIFGSLKEISKLDEQYRLKHQYILCSKPVTRNKNSSDISMVIEIMKDMQRNPAATTFIICSNDTDFIPLCKEIQSQGKYCWLAMNKQDAPELISQIYDTVIDLTEN